MGVFPSNRLTLLGDERVIYMGADIQKTKMACLPDQVRPGILQPTECLTRGAEFISYHCTTQQNTFYEDMQWEGECKKAKTKETEMRKKAYQGCLRLEQMEDLNTTERQKGTALFGRQILKIVKIYFMYCK